MNLTIEFYNNLIYFIPIVFALILLGAYKSKKGAFPPRETGGVIIFHSYEFSCAFALLLVFFIAHDTLDKFHALMHMVYAISVKIMWDSFNDIKDIF
jgi:hypothetical protein